jgi:ankyrin repeat protein
MAGKVNASSQVPSLTDEEPNNEFRRHENKQSSGDKGRLPSSPRQQRRRQQQQQQQQQHQQQSSRQSDHSQQPLHIEYERRTDPEEVSQYVHQREKHVTRCTQVNKPIPPSSKPKPSQKKAPGKFIDQSRQLNNVAESSAIDVIRQKRQKKHKLIFDVSSFQSNQNGGKCPASFAGDEISGLFTTNSKITSSTRQHSLGSEITDDDEERIRRFGDAYTAIMLAHQVNEVKPSEPRPSYSGKRWTRDPNIVSAMSIDGRSYNDLQRTPTLSLKQMMTSPDVYDSNKGMLNVELQDRKASWLVHIPRTSPKKSSGKERELFHVNYDITMNRKEFSSPDRKETVTAEIAPLTPCLRKLNDIEAKIQSIEKGQKFDLEENRRAVVQAGLPSRHKIAGQKDFVAISTSVNRRFNQLTIDEEPNVEEEQEEAPINCIYDNNAAEVDDKHDNNSGIDSTPIVRTSTLRLLFSGVSEGKQTNDSNENTSPDRHASKKSIHPYQHRSSFPASSNGHTFNHINKSTPQNQHTVTFAASNVQVESTHNKKSIPDNQHNEGKRDVNVPLLFDPSVQRPDPPDSVYQSSKETNSSQNVESAPQLEVANLVRASLVVHARSFIDTDENLDDFDEGEEQAITRSMSMSPSLITKRYQQALCAIEAKNWEQVSYLTHANPWLMEMKDVRNDQYLIHSLALYSGGQTADQLSIPEELVMNMLDYEPGVVHRLDTEGYLPLHMAAASGNIMMIKVLGEKFPAAASVQNHDGLLPLHLAVMSCALYATGDHAVDLILTLFPAGVIVKDNDGNTPLHTAAGALRGDVGVSIISRLLQVHENILTRNPFFFKESMGQPKVPKHFDEVSVVTLDDGGDESASSFLCMMKNNRGETPLVRAIKSRAGRHVVDILLAADGGSLAALDENSSGASALHLILRDEFYDAAAAISILKSAPSAAAIRDVNRNLPIQQACANSLQREIVLAIAIIDLPIDLGAKEDVIFRNGFGASWWFLLCDSNDKYVDIVTEILSLCSHPQKMALCLTMAGSNDEETAVACATPQCKAALRKSLRFLGRFEFNGDQNSNFASSPSVQKFDAIDYGPDNNPSRVGKKVSLICYGSNEVYLKEAKHLEESKLDVKFFEEFEHFSIGELDTNIPSDVKIYHCVAVIKSKLSLSRVVAGMPRKHEYRADHNLLKRYFSKVKSIMFRVGEGIYKLHLGNIIHGQIDSHNIMKFGDRWKITGLCGSVVRGADFSMTRLGTHSPPEAFVLPQKETSSPFVAGPSVDIWAFGKLIYEAFVGESIFASFVEPADENLQLRCIAGWSHRHVKVLKGHLTESGIGEMGIDLVCSCLRMEHNRPHSMANILQHEFWKENY